MIGDDEAFSAFHAPKIGAQVLAQLSDADGDLHVQNGSRWIRAFSWTLAASLAGCEDPYVCARGHELIGVRVDPTQVGSHEHGAIGRFQAGRRDAIAWQDS